MAGTAILCITQDDELSQAFRAAGRQMGAIVDLTPTLGEAARAVARRPYDLLVVEMGALPRQARKRDGRLFGGLPPVVALGHKDDIRDAVWAVHAGARDYVCVPSVDTWGLRRVLTRALRTTGMPTQDRAGALPQAPPFENFITVDHKLLAVCDALRSAADSTMPVVMWGESGTGKSTLARHMHQHSARRLGPFVKVNCNTRTRADLVDEFFGRPPADGDNPASGRLVEADGGTLLVAGGDGLPVDLLTDLLAGSQEGIFRRNGRVLESALRLVVTLSPRGLDDGHGGLRVLGGGSSEVVAVRLPPLRRRPADIPLLADHFLRVLSADYRMPIPEIAGDALSALLRYSWPGNVRELRNCIEHSVLFARQGKVRLNDLPHCVVDRQERRPPGQEAPQPAPLREALRGPERRYILRALRNAEGNKRDAARQLHISRSTLYKKLREHGLDNDAISRGSER